MTDAVVSQSVTEVAAQDGSPDVQVSQSVAEVASQAGSPGAVISQAVTGVLSEGNPPALVSQAIAEALSAGSPPLLVSQIITEVLVINLECLVPILFPTLDGLGYSVHWKPRFFNVTAETGSGAQIDLGLVTDPLHDFDLIYNVLRDGTPWTNSTEFKTMMGFFGAMRGQLGRCMFRNPDDNSVTGQLLGTTDGTTRAWTLTRTFGYGIYNWTEPVGWLDQTQPFNLYLDGVKQDPTTYSFTLDTGCDQEVVFNSAPTTGQEITCDMGYFYHCKLSDDTLDFEKFMFRMWRVGKLTLHSCRPGA